MPLLPGKSKKAFSKNVATEMEAGKSQPQSLAIAYSVKRKPKKKMADGGSVETEARGEKRPMPDNVYGDSNQVSRNSGDKALRDSDWTGQPTVRQSQSPSPHPLSQPKGVGSDSLAMRQRAMHDDESDLEDSVPPQSDKAQPIQRDNEEDPDRQGPMVPDMERQHNNKRSAYAKGGRVRYDDGGGVGDLIGTVAKVLPFLAADGGSVEQMEADDESDLERSASPSSPSEQPKASYDESHDYAPLSANPDEAHPHTGESENDMLRRHAMERAMYADGGNVDLEQSHMEPEETSMAQEIMRKRMMADGGEVDDDDEDDSFSNEKLNVFNDKLKSLGKGMTLKDKEHISKLQEAKKKYMGKFFASGGEVDLEANSEEDLNNEDQMSFKAGMKEQYNLRQLDKQPENSNEIGDSREDEAENDHDEDDVSAIMKKMRSRAK